MNHSNHHSDKDDLEQRLHSELRDYAPKPPTGYGRVLRLGCRSVAARSLFCGGG